MQPPKSTPSTAVASSAAQAGSTAAGAFAGRLGQAFRTGIQTSSVALSFLSLDFARQLFGADWPKVIDKVHRIVDETLRSFLTEGDVYTASDETSYVILLAEDQYRDAFETMESVRDEISRRVMGDGNRKVIAEVIWAEMRLSPVNVAGRERGATVEKKEETGEKVSNIQRILTEISSSQDDAFDLDNVQHVLRPMWSLPRRSVVAFTCTLFAPDRRGDFRYGYDLLPPDADAPLFAELDALAAERVAKELPRLLDVDRQTVVLVPVHRLTLSSRKYREMYLKICRGLFNRGKDRLMFEIAGIEDGTPPNRVMEHVQWLQPYARGIAATVPIDFMTMHSFAGTGMYSVGVSIDSCDEEFVEQKLPAFIARLKSFKTRCHVHGVKTELQLDICSALSVDAIDGDAAGEFSTQAPRREVAPGVSNGGLGGPVIQCSSPASIKV